MGAVVRADVPWCPLLSQSTNQPSSQGRRGWERRACDGDGDGDGGGALVGRWVGQWLVVPGGCNQLTRQRERSRQAGSGSEGKVGAWEESMAIGNDGQCSVPAQRRRQAVKGRPSCLLPAGAGRPAWDWPLRACSLTSRGAQQLQQDCSREPLLDQRSKTGLWGWGAV